MKKWKLLFLHDAYPKLKQNTMCKNIFSFRRYYDTNIIRFGTLYNCVPKTTNNNIILVVGNVWCPDVDQYGVPMSGTMVASTNLIAYSPDCCC